MMMPLSHMDAGADRCWPRGIDMHWFLGIVIALFGSMATAQEEEEEQTPVCYDMSTDADVVENVCFPRIDGYSLRTALDESGWEEPAYGTGYSGFWYGNVGRTASAYYGAADPDDQLESRVLVVHVTARAGFPLNRRTRSPGAYPDHSWRWGYESGIGVSAYLMTAANNDPKWDGVGRRDPYYKVVLKDNGNLVIEDCLLDDPWRVLRPTTVSGDGSALEPRVAPDRVAPDTEWPLKVSRMIRRYLEQEEAPAACS